MIKYRYVPFNLGKQRSTRKKYAPSSSHLSKDLASMHKSCEFSGSSPGNWVYWSTVVAPLPQQLRTCPLPRQHSQILVIEPPCSRGRLLLIGGNSRGWKTEKNFSIMPRGEFEHFLEEQNERLKSELTKIQSFIKGLGYHSSMDVDNKGGKDPRVDGDDDNHDDSLDDEDDDDDDDDDGHDVGENEDDFGYT